MFKVLISIVIATLLSLLQYNFENHEDTTKSYSKSIAIFVCVLILTYIGQILVFDGGIGNTTNNDKTEISHLMKNIEIGEAPF
jgi:hypothetical protein